MELTKEKRRSQILMMFKIGRLSNKTLFARSQILMMIKIGRLSNKTLFANSLSNKASL